MMLNFPDSPVLDEIFVTPKVDFRWVGDRWKREDAPVVPPVTPIVLTSLLPDRGPINDTTGTNVLVYGCGFTATCVTIWNGVQIFFYFTSATEGAVEVPVSPTPGAIDVFLREGTNDSNALTYTYEGVQPVLPVLTSLSPDRAPHGTFYGGTISYRGSGFDPSCVAYYDGAPAPSMTYISPTEIQAHGIDGPPMSAETVSKDCFVRNGVGDSAILPFRYYDQYAGVAYITFINPSSVSWHNSANIEVEVTGTDFSNDALVMMGPHPMVTRYVAQNMVRFDVIPTDYSTGQDHEWTVTVDQANGVSNGMPFFFIF